MSEKGSLSLVHNVFPAKKPAAQYSHSADISSLNATHSSDEIIIFLDTIQTGSDTAWNITAQLNQHQVPFKLDTGAELSDSHLSYNKYS